MRLLAVALGGTLVLGSCATTFSPNEAIKDLNTVSREELVVALEGILVDGNRSSAWKQFIGDGEDSPRTPFLALEREVLTRLVADFERIPLDETIHVILALHKAGPVPRAPGFSAYQGDDGPRELYFDLGAGYDTGRPHQDYPTLAAERQLRQRVLKAVSDDLGALERFAERYGEPTFQILRQPLVPTLDKPLREPESLANEWLRLLDRRYPTPGELGDYLLRLGPGPAFPTLGERLGDLFSTSSLRALRRAEHDDLPDLEAAEAVLRLVPRLLQVWPSHRDAWASLSNRAQFQKRLRALAQDRGLVVTLNPRLGEPEHLSYQALIRIPPGRTPEVQSPLRLQQSLGFPRAVALVFASTEECLRFQQAQGALVAYGTLEAMETWDSAFGTRPLPVIRVRTLEAF